MLFCILFAAGIIDLKYRKIPDTVITAMLLCAAIFGDISVYEKIWGFIFPAFLLFFIALKNKKLKGGDIKYLAALGLNVGISGLTGILFPACIFSVFYSIIWKRNSVPLAFMCLIGYIFWRCFL